LDSLNQIPNLTGIEEEQNMSYLDDVVGDMTNAVSRIAQDVEGIEAAQTAQSVLGGPGGNLIGSLLGGLGTGGTSPYAALPELSQMLGGLSGLTGTQNPAQQFGGGGLQTMPYPWSQQASGIPSSLFNDPSQLNSSLSSASSALLDGINNSPLGSFDAGSIDQQVNALQNKAAGEAAKSPMQAMQDMQKAQALEQMAQQLLSILASELKDSIQNWKVQG
jgi:hypothetical protein